MSVLGTSLREMRDEKSIESLNIYPKEHHGRHTRDAACPDIRATGQNDVKSWPRESPEVAVRNRKCLVSGTPGTAGWNWLVDASHNSPLVSGITGAGLNDLKNKVRRCRSVFSSLSDPCSLLDSSDPPPKPGFSSKMASSVKAVQTFGKKKVRCVVSERRRRFSEHAIDRDSCCPRQGRPWTHPCQWIPHQPRSA